MTYLQLREEHKRLQMEQRWVEWALTSQAPTLTVQRNREYRLKLVKFKISYVEFAMKMHENRIHRALEIIDTTEILRKAGIKYTIKNNTIYL